MRRAQENGGFGTERKKDCYTERKRQRENASIYNDGAQRVREKKMSTQEVSEKDRKSRSLGTHRYIKVCYR